MSFGRRQLNEFRVLKIRQFPIASDSQSQSAAAVEAARKQVMPLKTQTTLQGEVSPGPSQDIMDARMPQVGNSNAANDGGSSHPAAGPSGSDEMINCR